MISYRPVTANVIPSFNSNIQHCVSNADLCQLEDDRSLLSWASDLVNMMIMKFYLIKLPFSVILSKWS